MTLVQLILDACRIVDNFHSTRSLYSVNHALQSEVGELAEEIAIEMGDSYKEHGPDGLPGEGIDALISALDLLYVNNRNLSEERLVAIAKPKLEKWIAKVMQANAEGKLK